uniref:Thioesterase domain-containing protein n=1 Tax=Picea sitchensis TaxID=3332 RepID=D5ADS0_PICSI|nr:unknown [Picea sitchensis]
MDPTVTRKSIDASSPESQGRKWLQGLGADGRSFLPPEYQNSGFNDSLSLRHLKVDRVESGLVIATLTVKPSLTNGYNTLHGGASATVASIVAMAAVKTLSGADKTFSLSEMGISYISAASINVELEIEAKVLRFGKSIAVSSIDIRNKTTKQITFQGRATFYHMPTSSL